MKIVVLTTDTRHHTFFIKSLATYFSDLFVIAEGAPFSAQKLKDDQFLIKQDQFEKARWFENAEVNLQSLASDQILKDLSFVDSINSSNSIEQIKQHKADITIVFGTGKLNLEAILAHDTPLLNLHGGDPEHYRGLDSHMWAIYHKEFSQLCTSIHHLTETLDAGDIVQTGTIPIPRNTKLHELRAFNTELCVKLAVSAVDCYARFNSLPSRPQRQKGRYYSAIPKSLLDRCEKNFHVYTATLSDIEASEIQAGE